MSIYFSSVCKTVAGRAKIITPNSERVLINFWDYIPKQLSSEYIYALKSSKLKQFKNLDDKTLLVLEDVPLPEECQKAINLNMILTKDPDLFQQLKIDIQRLFDEQAKISNYAYQLMQLCYQEAGPQKILDAGYSSMNNPIVFVDTAFSLQYYTGAYEDIDDSVLSFCLKNKHLPNEFLNELITETYQYSDEDFPDLVRLDHEEKNFVDSSIVSARVSRGGQLLGYLKLFEYNHPITFIEKNYLIILAGFLAIALGDSLPRLPLSRIQIEDFLTAMLEGRIVAPDAIQQRVSLYHMESDTPMKAIAIKYDTYLTTIDKLHFLKRQLKQIFNTPVITFYNNLVVCVINVDVLNSQLDTFISFLESNQLVAGVSLPFESYVNFKRYCRQAIASLDMHKIFNMKTLFVDYDQLKMEHLFLHFQDYCYLEELFPKALLTLMDIDRKKGSNLVETLFTFIHHRQDITSAANDLHLHYNTLKYRINRITEQVDIDFDDYDCMFQFIIAEKIMQLIQKNPNLENGTEKHIGYEESEEYL